MCGCWRPPIRTWKPKSPRAAFREDLYYRIKVIHIHMPPLREIREEIPLLANHFLKEYCRETGRAADGVRAGSAAQAGGAPLARQRPPIAQRSDAPGRLRAAERDRPKRICGKECRRPSRDQPARRQPVEAASRLKKAVAELEKRMIQEALEETRNNQQQAARLLGLSRQGLINKMKRYAIPG